MNMIESKHSIIVALIVCLFLFTAQKADAVTETSRDDYKLSNGVYESTIYADDSEGNNLCIHVIKLNKNSGVSFKTGYGGYYRKDSDAEQRKTAAKQWNQKKWKCEKIASQLNEFNSIKDRTGDVIAAINADHFKKNGKVIGNLVIEGNVIRQSKDEPYFAVMKNGELDIRSAQEPLDNVQEAVGGSYLLVNAGKVIVDHGGDREPRMALGLDDKQNAIIIAVEGRSPYSPGATLYETAKIMKQQGCTKAINLDGGGSSSVLTRRAGELDLKHRNRLLESTRRNIASVMYIIKPFESSKESGNGSSNESNNGSINGSSEDSSKRIEKDQVPKKMDDKKNSFNSMSRLNKERGFCMINGKPFCFVKHNKGYTGTVKIGKYKYVFKDGELKKSSDAKAGNFCIGQCGSTGKESGLVYVYHSKDKVLNIGVNPFLKIKTQMKNWEKAIMTPWHSIKTEINKVYINNKVKSIGDNFLCFPRIENYDGTPLPGASIDVLHISKSVTKIGCKSFYNLGNVNDIKVYDTFEEIGKEALDYSNLKKVIKKKQ